VAHKIASHANATRPARTSTSISCCQFATATQANALANQMWLDMIVISAKTATLESTATWGATRATATPLGRSMARATSSLVSVFADPASLDFGVTCVRRTTMGSR